MKREEQYRLQARSLIRRISKARELFSQHKPSIGYVGEEALRRALKRLLPNDYDVCQGFVINKNLKCKENLSRQCDIIIYRRDQDAIEYSYGDLKIIHANSVIAVIEVKSSIREETFITTLKAFEKLNKLGVSYKYIFIFESLSKRSLEQWLKRHQLVEKNSKDLPLYDWPDLELFPNAILSLNSCNYFKLTHLQDDRKDWVGFASYMIKDGMNKEISCLQEFFATVMDLLEDGTFEIDINDYSIKDGFLLFDL